MNNIKNKEGHDGPESLTKDDCALLLVQIISCNLLSLMTILYVCFAHFLLITILLKCIINKLSFTYIPVYYPIAFTSRRVILQVNVSI